MTDLDLEHCEKLKDWGMDQELEVGDWYWFQPDPDKDNWELERVGVQLEPAEGTYFKIPSLDALLEFAAQFKSPWNIRNVTPPVVKNELPKGFVMLEWPDGFLLGYPIELLYALIAKLMEVERGDK